MKTDLYGSIEAIADRVNRTVTTVDPSKRGVPRISDVQLVPPRPIPNQELDTGTQENEAFFENLDGSD